MKTSAFSLVEVTLALGIAAFCLIAVFGLIPVGMQTNRDATSRTRATNMMTGVIADLRATPTCIATSTQYQITLGTLCSPASPPSPKTLYFSSEGEASCDLAGSQKADCASAWSPAIQTRYRLTVTFPTSPTGLSYADLRVTWPAPVNPATGTPSGNVEMFTALDRN
jgi:uncharacterized protein (TIGR02598 family)